MFGRIWDYIESWLYHYWCKPEEIKVEPEEMKEPSQVRIFYKSNYNDVYAK